MHESRTIRYRTFGLVCNILFGTPCDQTAVYVYFLSNFQKLYSVTAKLKSGISVDTR